MANIVISEPEDACKKIKEPPTDNENENLIWFVLVDISNCFSDTKVIYMLCNEKKKILTHILLSLKLSVPEHQRR